MRCFTAGDHRPCSERGLTMTNNKAPGRNDSQDDANARASPAGGSWRRRLLALALSSGALLAMGGWQVLEAESQKAKIVGLGAATCQRFSDDVKANPVLRRDYLAWAQGFLSGIILSRPPGMDEGLEPRPGNVRSCRPIAFP